MSKFLIQVLNKKGLPEQTFFGRSSVLQSDVLQLKPRILRGNTEALYKLLLHTSIDIIASGRYMARVVHSLKNEGMDKKPNPRFQHPNNTNFY